MILKITNILTYKNCVVLKCDNYTFLKSLVIIWPVYVDLASRQN